MDTKSTMSRRRDGVLGPLAKRLRFLRGDETQESFAKRVGISRSALANYETGRSVPDEFTQLKILRNAGFSDDYLTEHYDPFEPHSPGAVFGAVIEGLPDWTEDEATLVRILRLCDRQTIEAVLEVVLRGVSQQEMTVKLGTIFTIKDDLQRLMEVQSGVRPYAKGVIGTYAEDSPLYRLGFKTKPKPKPDEGPQ